MAHEARAAVPASRGVVVMPNVFGLTSYYRGLAERFAEAGIDAIAMDYYARSATDDVRGNRDVFDWELHRARTAPETIALDAAACAAHLRDGAARTLEGIYALGFSWGGSNALRQAAADWSAGAIAFYPWQPLSIRPAIDRIRVPLLILQAGRDPQEEHAQLIALLRERGIRFTAHVYPDATHNFFDQTAAQHPDESADAWTRVREFVSRR